MNDQKSAELARSAAIRLLKAAEDATATGATVLAEKQTVFPPAYSWWRLICRTSEGVMQLLDAGFTVEVAPLMRNIFNHAYALHWLVDNGEPALGALVALGDEAREKLYNKLAATGWPNAAEYRKAMDEYAAQRVTITRTPAEETLHNKLKHELGNVHDMLDRYGSPELYPVYAHLSGLSHTSIFTASAYVERMDDGAYQIRPTAESLGYADIIQLALALLQAALVMSPLLDGDPLRSDINKVMQDFGLEGAQLLPNRAKGK